jgi:hypothetical protein
VGNWDFWGPEFHDQKLINAATGAGSVWLRGAINMRFWGCLLDSASAGAGNLYAQNVNGVGCSVLLIGNTFYTETPGFLPKHNLYCEAGSVLEIAGFKNSYTFGTSKKGGGGAFPFVGVETA